MRVLAVALLLAAACSAPATLSELSTAERRADQGDTEGALVAYREAQAKCGRLRPARRAKAACADSLFGEVEHFGLAEQGVGARRLRPVRGS